MSDDVTIDRETAKEWAALLRSSTRDRLNPDWTPLADLLDPPQPSLRTAIANTVAPFFKVGYEPKWEYLEVYANDLDTCPEDRITDAVLALVRTRIEALPVANTDDLWVRRDDVLALLGGDDE